MQGLLLEQLVAKSIVAAGAELYHMNWSRSSGGETLLVRIDKADGVKLEDCIAVNKQIKFNLAAEYPDFSGSIEVSSPGVNRGLYKAWHYEKVVGKNIKVKYSKDNENVTLEGLLQAFDDSRLSLLAVTGVIEISLCDIIKASLLSDGG